MNLQDKAKDPLSPIWMFYVLLAAGAYNLLWGTFVILFPHLFFDWAGMDRPLYPEIWQCVGMIVGVYGIGYLVAAFDPLRFWPIVLVGFLGKVLGPMGFVQALWLERFSLSFGWNIIFNDLIWWVPFFLILKWSFLELQKPLVTGEVEEPTKLLQEELSDGQSVAQLSQNQAIVLVFLRHFGCSFCRDLVTQVRVASQTQSDVLERLIFVHMSSESRGREFFQSFGLPSARAISDPHQIWYRSFGLPRSSWGDLFSPRLWWRGFRSAILRRHGVGRLEGDGFQMPGYVVIRAGKIHSQVSFSDFSREFQFSEIQEKLRLVDA